MNWEEEIRIKLKKNSGIVTAEELKKSNIPTIYLTRMVAKGMLTRVDRGIYIDQSGDYDEYYFFSQRYKSVVFSYVSALYLHQFTDIIPQNMEVTVYKGYNPHRLGKNVIIHYVNKEHFNLGIIECKTIFGNKVNVYNLERIICDFIKNRSDIDSELFSKTINRYIRTKNKDFNKLYDYSKKMRISDKVREILEVIGEQE